MRDKNLTEDVLDEIIAAPKTALEQLLALELKFERKESNKPVVPDEIVGWVREEEDGDTRDPLFLCGTIRPSVDGKVYRSHYYPVKRATVLNGGD